MVFCTFFSFYDFFGKMEPKTEPQSRKRIRKRKRKNKFWETVYENARGKSDHSLKQFVVFTVALVDWEGRIVIDEFVNPVCRCIYYKLEIL